MFRRSISLLIALSVSLLLQFADCQAMSADQQTMKCCHTMPCHPANQAHDCCKKMASSETPSLLPSLPVSLSAPLAIPADPVIVPLNSATEIFWPVIESPQHSPPRLYTLYASLLI
jgi:hypothetical protein